MKVIVIIPAAGLGTRMAPMPSALDAKTKKPHPSKQFTELAGTPILMHTLRKFAAVDAVKEIWIALRENEIEGFRERLAKEASDVLKKKKVELVAGGEHRQQSVEQALNALSAASDDVVLVPCVPWSPLRSFTRSSRPRRNMAPPSPAFPQSIP